MRLAKRVLLVAWPGADWKLVSRLTDAGLLPNVQRLMENGILAPAASLTPQVGPPLYTSITTGVHADQHGILTSIECDPRTGQARPPLSTSRRRKALWNILSERGARSIVVGWPAQYPVETIHGISVSAEFFDAVAPPHIPWTAPPDSLYPIGLAPRLTQLCVHSTELTAAELFPFFPNLASIDQKKDRRLAALTARLARAINTQAVTTSLMESEPWDFLAVSNGLIEAAALEVNRTPDLCNQATEMAYRFSDLMLGRLIQLAGEDSLIILASAFGFHRFQENAAPRITPGFFCMAGPHLKTDEIMHGATLLDIAPTILFALGLPIGRDVQGTALTSAFLDPPRPEYVATWESRTTPLETNGYPDDAALWKTELATLGYRDPQVEQIAELSLRIERERALNLAAVYLSSGRLPQAAEPLEGLRARRNCDELCLLMLSYVYLVSGAYDNCRALLPFIPDNPQTKPIVTAIKSFLCAAAGQRKEALALAREAENSASLSPLLAYGIGCIYLSLGKCGKAEAAFRKAAEINPSYWLAQHGRASALRRLGRLEAAAEAVRASLQENFAVPESHRLLAITLLGLGDHARAVQAFRTARALSPAGVY